MIAVLLGFKGVPFGIYITDFPEDSDVPKIRLPTFTLWLHCRMARLA